MNSKQRQNINRFCCPISWTGYAYPLFYLSTCNRRLNDSS